LPDFLSSEGKVGQITHIALSFLPVPIYAEAHRMSAHIVAGGSDADHGRVDRKPRGRIGS
jgi:hypothetical protein